MGPQYRSILLPATEEQHRIAERVLREVDAAGLWSRPIVTEIAPLSVFYPAEAYHQEYFRRNPGKPYCRLVIEPKVAKFRHQFTERLRRPG